MAFGKKIADELGINRKKEHKFMDGIKDWVASPGGLVTIVLLLGTIWWVNHKTHKKGA